VTHFYRLRAREKTTHWRKNNSLLSIMWAGPQGCSEYLDLNPSGLTAHSFSVSYKQIPDGVSSSRLTHKLSDYQDFRDNEHLLSTLKMRPHMKTAYATIYYGHTDGFLLKFCGEEMLGRRK
jgi:hypothetical protein